MSQNDRQVGGGHYGGKEFQHWDWAVANFGPAYLAAQVTRYIVRWKLKNGREDIEKAGHYLEKLMEIHAQGVPFPTRLGQHQAKQLDQLVAMYKLNEDEMIACDIMVTYRHLADLYAANIAIQNIIEGSKKSEQINAEQR